MSSYFSRLASQTGLINSPPGGQRLSKKLPDAETRPIDREISRTVEQPPSMRPPPLPAPSVDGHDVPDTHDGSPSDLDVHRDSLEGDMPAETTPPLESPRTEAAPDRRSHIQTPTEPGEDVRSAKVEPSGSEAPPEETRVDYRQQPMSEKPVDQVLHVESTSDSSDPPQTRQAKMSAPIITGSEAAETTSERMRIWQKTFHEVCEWVAATPEESPGDRPDEVTDHKFVPDRKQDIETGGEPAPPVHTATAGVQDLHLEIGSITVSVEGPPVKAKALPPVRPDAPRQPGEPDSGSRLGRHYIRVR